MPKHLSLVEAVLKEMPYPVSGGAGKTIPYKFIMPAIRKLTKFHEKGFGFNPMIFKPLVDYLEQEYEVSEPMVNNLLVQGLRKVYGDEPAPKEVKRYAAELLSAAKRAQSQHDPHQDYYGPKDSVYPGEEVGKQDADIKSNKQNYSTIDTKKDDLIEELKFLGQLYRTSRKRSDAANYLRKAKSILRQHMGPEPSWVNRPLENTEWNKKAEELWDYFLKAPVRGRAP